MKIVAIIQARMGSTRLPGKIMKILEDRTVLGHVIHRLKAVKSIDQIIVATTTRPEDQIIANEAEYNGVLCYCGSEEDVLARYYEAAKKFDASIIVRITSDCPLIDPILTEKVIQYFLDHDTEYTRLDLGSFPRGLDVEVISLKALKESHMKAVNPEHREHVTLYVYQNPEEYRNVIYTNDEDFSKYRLTLDTQEDWELIYQVFKQLYHIDVSFDYKDILNLLQRFPELAEINQYIVQKHQTK